MIDLFKKKDEEEEVTEDSKTPEKKPQRLATIVDMTEPLDVFPDEQI